ncbi:hypothetical protein B0H12DRAFT_131776 [Mycena haematopus]|nr:hypothetical protein B0H12DRAFT_131776 [Mycena haematopus]
MNEGGEDGDRARQGWQVGGIGRQCSRKWVQGNVGQVRQGWGCRSICLQLHSNSRARSSLTWASPSTRRQRVASSLPGSTPSIRISDRTACIFSPPHPTKKNKLIDVEQRGGRDGRLLHVVCWRGASTGGGSSPRSLGGGISGFLSMSSPVVGAQRTAATLRCQSGSVGACTETTTGCVNLPPHANVSTPPYPSTSTDAGFAYDGPHPARRSVWTCCTRRS